MNKLTTKQQWMLNYLKDNSNYANCKAVEYVSPTEVGIMYGESMGKKGYHSSVASHTLKNLTELGFLIRNDKGHYKFNDKNKTKNGMD
jgi:hypothetical protein